MLFLVFIASFMLGTDCQASDTHQAAWPGQVSIMLSHQLVRSSLNYVKSPACPVKHVASPDFLGMLGPGCLG